MDMCGMDLKYASTRAADRNVNIERSELHASDGDSGRWFQHGRMTSSPKRQSLTMRNIVHKGPIFGLSSQVRK